MPNRMSASSYCKRTDVLVNVREGERGEVDSSRLLHVVYIGNNIR